MVNEAFQPGINYRIERSCDSANREIVEEFQGHGHDAETQCEKISKAFKKPLFFFDFAAVERLNVASVVPLELSEALELGGGCFANRLVDYPGHALRIGGRGQGSLVSIVIQLWNTVIHKVDLRPEDHLAVGLFGDVV